MRKPRSAAARFISFFVTVAVAVLLLKLLNWIPAAVQKEDLRKYRSVEEARSALKIKKILIPSFFPEHIQWPPVEVFAQRKPFTLIVMHFTHTADRDLALSIFQTDEHAPFDPQKASDILYVRQETSTLVNGKPAKLVLAVCQGNKRCNSIEWNVDSYRLIIVADDTPEQILKLAESML